MSEKPVISGTEIGRWKLRAREYKILALAVVLNILTFGIVFQQDNLNKRGCETRIGNVLCSALNAVIIAGGIVGTDAGLVDRDYVRTVLDDSDLKPLDSARYVVLRYPEGFFLIGKPERENQPKSETPKPAPQAREKSRSDSDDSGTEASLDEPIIGSLTNPDAEIEVFTDPNTGVEINRRVLRDYANYVKARVESDSLDLEGIFTIVAEGVLNEKGRLDTSLDPRTGRPKSRIISSRGDADMREVAKEAIAAVGDSGWLIYLRNQGIEKINFTVMQDGSEVKIRITSEQPNPESARTIASGLRGIIQGALLLDRNNVKRLGSDERILLNSAKTSVNRRQFVLDFVMPKPVAHEMIKRRLREMDGGRSRPTGLADSKDLRNQISE